MALQIKKIFKHIKSFVVSFIDTELTLYAASMSFYTIFIIIPFLLIFVSIFSYLPMFSEYYELIKNFLFSNLLPLHSEKILTYIDGFLANAVSIGVIGFGAIVIASLFFFQNFEYITNKIFKTKNTTMFKSIETYIILLVLTPSTLALSLYITTTIDHIVNIGMFISYIILWVMFFIIFHFTANTSIHPKASLISSLLVSIAFGISKNIFVYYVFYNKLYATIYGSFAVLIFLFLWIYVSWIIFIYGLKICYLINRLYKTTS